jgi:hypothetical protein
MHHLVWYQWSVEAFTLWRLATIGTRNNDAVCCDAGHSRALERGQGHAAVAVEQLGLVRHPVGRVQALSAEDPNERANSYCYDMPCKRLSSYASGTATASGLQPRFKEFEPWKRSLPRIRERFNSWAAPAGEGILGGHSARRCS